MRYPRWRLRRRQTSAHTTGVDAASRGRKFWELAGKESTNATEEDEDLLTFQEESKAPRERLAGGGGWERASIAREDKGFAHAL